MFEHDSLTQSNYVWWTNEIKRIIDECYARCSEILKEQADKVNTTAQLLLEKEKISGEEFKAVMQGNPVIEAEIVEETALPAEAYIDSFAKRE